MAANRTTINIDRNENDGAAANNDNPTSSRNSTCFKLNDDDDLLLESFFQEVEGLTISDHNICNEGGENVPSGGNKLAVQNKGGNDEAALVEQKGRNVIKDEQNDKGQKKQQTTMLKNANDVAADINNVDKKNKTRRKETDQERQRIYKKAEEKKNAWVDFKIENEKEGRKVLSQDPERSTISFAIPTNKKAVKKKKQKKQQVKETVKTDEQKNAMAPVLDTTPALSVSASKAGIDEGPPSWIAVLDTCALLDQCDCIADIIAVARDAAVAPNNNSSHVQHLNNSEVSMMEPIQVVIPYIVWSELDGLSKGGGINDRGENISFRARLAIRMLQAELQNEQQHQLVIRQQQQSTVNATPVTSILRPETLEEMNYASSTFLQDSSLSSATNINDDRILACALSQRNKHHPSSTTPSNEGAPTAGGVVLLSKDNNLKCKSYANGITPYEPFEFVLMYGRRLKARKDIAKQKLVNRALPK